MGLLRSTKEKFNTILFVDVESETNVPTNDDLESHILCAANLVLVFRPKSRKTWQDVVKLEVLYSESNLPNLPIQKKDEILLVAYSAFRVNYANGIINREELSRDRVNYLLFSVVVQLSHRNAIKGKSEDIDMLRRLAIMLTVKQTSIVPINSYSPGKQGRGLTLPFTS